MKTATETKERPILFSGPMVRAILAGRKTQTRRVVKPQWEPDAMPEEMSSTTPEGWQTAGRSGRWWCGTGADQEKACPYGKAGDRLWVRETFYCDVPDEQEDDRGENLYYRADGECCQIIPECACAEVGKPRWRPSIFMPRWACRIILEVTDVRVERLQEIGEVDAEAEGSAHRITGDGDLAGAFAHIEGPVSYVAHFKGLWDGINAKRGFGWDENPWVWVVGFRKCEPAK